jgi:hypothetical protein
MKVRRLKTLDELKNAKVTVTIVNAGNTEVNPNSFIGQMEGHRSSIVDAFHMWTEGLITLDERDAKIDDVIKDAMLT